MRRLRLLKGRLTMKKYALAGAALAGVTAFTGASAAPATAPVAELQAAQTLSWRLNESAHHSVGNNSIVGTDVIRSARTREIIGYDSFTLKFYPKTHVGRIQFAASVKGGILVAVVHGRFTSDHVVLHGRILRGTDTFTGAEGTVTATPIGDGSKTQVVIHYTS
jgi:hypothetical protein